MRWRRSDLDFPALMLQVEPWPAVVSGIGGPGGLCGIAVGYGDGAELLRLETVARRGKRMGPDGAYGLVDDLPGCAAAAILGLGLSTIEPGTDPEVARRRVEECSDRGRSLAGQFPGPPWQARSAPVDGVGFALWSTTVPGGFAAALDYGPVVLTAWGREVDAWDWRLTAATPERTWSLMTTSAGVFGT